MSMTACACITWASVTVTPVTPVTSAACAQESVAMSARCLLRPGGLPRSAGGTARGGGRGRVAVDDRRDDIDGVGEGRVSGAEPLGLDRADQFHAALGVQPAPGRVAEDFGRVRQVQRVAVRDAGAAEDERAGVPAR